MQEAASSDREGVCRRPPVRRDRANDWFGTEQAVQYALLLFGRCSISASGCLFNRDRRMRARHHLVRVATFGEARQALRCPGRRGWGATERRAPGPGRVPAPGRGFALQEKM